MSLRISSSLTALSLALASVASPAVAANAVLTMTGGQQSSGFADDETIGWVFTADNWLTASALGWWVDETGLTLGP